MGSDYISPVFGGCGGCGGGDGTAPPPPTAVRIGKRGQSTFSLAIRVKEANNGGTLIPRKNTTYTLKMEGSPVVLAKDEM